MCKRWTISCGVCLDEMDSFFQPCAYKRAKSMGKNLGQQKSCPGEQAQKTIKKCEFCEDNEKFEARLEAERQRIRASGTITRETMGLPPLEPEPKPKTSRKGKEKKQKDLYTDANYEKDAEGEGWVEEISYHTEMHEPTLPHRHTQQGNYGLPQYSNAQEYVHPQYSNVQEYGNPQYSNVQEYGNPQYSNVQEYGHPQYGNPQVYDAPQNPENPHYYGYPQGYGRYLG